MRNLMDARACSHCRARGLRRLSPLMRCRERNIRLSFSALEGWCCGQPNIALTSSLYHSQTDALTQECCRLMPLFGSLSLLLPCLTPHFPESCSYFRASAARSRAPPRAKRPASHQVMNHRDNLGTYQYPLTILVSLRPPSLQLLLPHH